MPVTSKVILLKGNPKNPESSEHIIKFPGGSVSVLRTTNSEYWAHIEVNHDQVIDDTVRESKKGNIVDTRLDYDDGDIINIASPDQLRHLAVRINTK